MRGMLFKEENQHNDPPEDGYQFVMVKVRVSYTGKESGVLFVTGLRKYNNFHLFIPQPFRDV